MFGEIKKERIAQIRDTLSLEIYIGVSISHNSFKSASPLSL